MQINDVFNRLEDKKKQLRDRKERMKDELKNNPRYMEIEEQIAALKQEKKQIEMTLISQDDKAEIDNIKVDIKTDKELLSDLALNTYVSGEQLTVFDELQRPYEPRFSVKFSKR